MKTTIYLATARGLGVIAGSEQNWHGAITLEGTQIQSVVADRNQPGVVFCGTFGDGILKSSDGGLTWKALSSLGKATVTALASVESGILYAGTEPSAIYRSDDGGESWSATPSLMTLPSAKRWSFPPRPDTHHVQAILPDTAYAGRLHVAIEAGALLRGDDEGTTWRDRVSSGPFDTHTLAAHPENPSRLFSAAGDGCFESLDDGDSWRKLDDGLAHQYCWSIAISAVAPETMLLSASQGAFTAHSTGSARSFIYRRVGNEPWKLAMEGLSKLKGARIPILAASLREPRVIYLAAEGVVYRSADDGSRWQPLPVQWTGESVARHSLNMAILEEEL
jgi:photosystem II stability/assembly factor-like uncharacterized protein